MRAVNVDLQRSGRQGATSKGFYCFQEDLYGWESDEPIRLYLFAEQAARLVDAGILSTRS